MNPKAARRVPNQRTPPAADIQETIARLQRQLAADMVELRGLRPIQRCAGLIEVGAGIHHLRVQEKFVELVGAVVVETNVSRRGAAGAPALREPPRIPAAKGVEKLAPKGGCGL